MSEHTKAAPTGDGAPRAAGRLGSQSKREAPLQRDKKQSSMADFTSSSKDAIIAYAAEHANLNARAKGARCHPQPRQRKCACSPSGPV